MAPTWVEVDPLGPQPGGDVGGDLQCTEAWCRQFKLTNHTGDGQPVITVYIFGAHPDLDSDEIVMQRMTEYLVVTSDQADATEVYANYHHRQLDDGTWADPASAEKEAQRLAEEITAAEFDWDGLPRSENDCHLVPIAITPHLVFIRCVTHDCHQMGYCGTVHQAMARFACDRGHHWRFLLHYPDQPDDIPTWGDLSLVRSWITRYEEDLHLGVADMGPLQIWRWVQGVEFEPIVWTKVDGTGDWVSAPEDNGGPLMAYPNYRVTNSDGTAEYLRVVVPINGDA